MTWELISSSDYDNLPESPYLKFVAIENICRRNMNSLIGENTPGDFDEMIRLQYMHIVAATASELGIENVTYEESGDGTYRDLQLFTARVAAVSARLMLRSPSLDPYSVKLARRTKGLIESKLAALREIIEQAEHLTPAKRRELLKRLEDFRTELHKDRLSFSKAFALVAYITAGLGGGASFLADAPGALGTVQQIVHMVGRDKELEDAERIRLGGPETTKALPSPKVDPEPTSSNESPYAHYDADDIPF